jgi:two-component system, chemotaxis family, CheB/CheR fusion protein
VFVTRQSDRIGDGATEPASHGDAEASGLPPFPIVGIGASAGGLEAVSRLLEDLPPDSGMALVVVQHLAPAHESILAELLGHKSPLPVSEVIDGVAVVADHAYVIPPGFDLSLDGGRLRLTPRDQAQRPPMPIDGFFRSLASTLGRRAIGVVLSGAASDGTLGLAAIKAEGGITFAQDPAEAAYDGMPRAAITAGAVDYILSPSQIAAELVRIAGHPYVAPAGSEVALPARLGEAKELYPQIFDLLRQAFGVDFTYYKFNTIGRRIARRMVLRHIELLNGYVALLRDDPAELEALYQDVLIMVTEFFRDPETFSALRNTVFPALIDGRSADQELRVWVPGCATGEEAYSLAIALIDFLGPGVRPPVKIFATDVNQRAIDRARPGIYGESIAGTMPPNYLERYFSQVDKGYQVAKGVRERCIFATHDLTRDPPFSHLDLISCRNLLIYLGPVLQKRVIPTLHYALAPKGYLVLGASETVGSHGTLFDVIDKKHRIYLARGRSRYPAADVWPTKIGTGLTAARPPSVAAAVRQRQPFDVDRAAEAILLESYTPPAVVINDSLEIVRFRGQTEPYLRHVAGRATLNLLAMVSKELAVHLGAAIADARRTGEPTSRRDLPVRLGERDDFLHLHVVPITESGDAPYFIVLFEAAPVEPASTQEGRKTKTTRAKNASVERELAATRDYLQAVIEDKESANEEMRAANEEIQSANEELQSINEELETAKEELQSTNEELVTVNDELSGRNTELSALTDDLSNLFASTDIPLIMVDRDLHARRLTPAVHEVLGIAQGALDRPLADLDLPFDTPDLAQQVRTVIDTLAPLVAERQDRKGHWYSLRVQPYTTADDAVAGAVIALVDIDEIKRSAEQIRETALLNAALAAIHLEISSTMEIDEILSRAVVQSAESLQAETASIVVSEHGAWVTRYAHGYGAEVLGTRFTDAELPHATLAAGTRAPVAISHAGDDRRIGLAAVKLLKLRSVLAVPLVSKDEVSGVLLFNWHDRPVTLSDMQIDFATKLASSVSLALDNARLYAERTESVRLAEALYEISSAISAAPDVAAIARIVAGEGLRAIGCEGAVVVLAEDNEFVARVAIGAAEPLLGQRFDRDESPIGELARTHQPLVANDASKDPRLASDFAARFGLQAVLFVPLLVRAKLAGFLAFANVSSGVDFSHDQVLFAASLASSSSLAIESVHAYEIEHRTAETLRRLLAFPLPELPALRIGTAHQVAAWAERVGGDFFDAFALDEHTIALFIADVSGKGVLAAGFTETIRSAVRALAYIDPSPAVVMGHVNESLIRQASDGLFATAALFVIDTATGDMRYSSAGHPPAILCGKRCAALPTKAGVPLGTFSQPYQEQSRRLAPGEVVVAFTDGITEARRGKKLFGDARVVAQLGRSESRDPQDLVDGLMAGAVQFAGGKLSDDAAIIAVSLARGPTSSH